MRQKKVSLATKQVRTNLCSREDSDNLPYLSYAVVQKQLKGEDVLFLIDDLSKCDSDRPDLVQWSVYCICDGHGGAGAARFVREFLGLALCKVLPNGNQLPPFNTPEGIKFCESIRHALVKAFTSLHDAFGSTGCRTSGTTVSVALVCGWLMTVANAGDSDVFLDLNHQIVEMTFSHKVSSNKSEVCRLEEAGAKINRLSKHGSHPPLPGEEGRGPLRVWPGGIAMSRSLGDIDCGPHILPVPHVRQIIIPRSGARLILASDGLWDHLTGEDACKISRPCLLSAAPMKLLKLAQEKAGGQLSDDISILVLDLMHKEQTDFSQMATQEAPSRLVPSVKNLIRRAMVKNSESYSGKQEFENFYADIDGHLEYKNSLDNIVPAISDLGHEDVSDSECRSRSSSVASDNWDMCECHWDCPDASSSSWEKDDRDILDSAQNYVHSVSTDTKKMPTVRITVMREKNKFGNDKRSSACVLMDTSMNASYTMSTIKEPLDDSHCNGDL